MEGRLLIVEDDVIIANNLRDRLKGLGYDVCGVAFSGKEAIEQVGEARPDLVLMDIKLGDEMDGITAAEQLRARFDIPVVYLTGYADEITLQRAKRSDPYGYILKPFELRDLHATIEMALHKYTVEQKLKESERKYRTLVEHSLQGIMIIQGAPPQVVFANDQCAEITGYSTSELTELAPEDAIALVDPEDQGWLMLRLIDHLDGKPVPTTGAFRVVRRDGAMRWVEYYASRIEREGSPAIQTAFVDITGRKQAEDALRQAHDQLEQRVEERTAELADANRRLRKEVAIRREAEQALQRRNRELAMLHRVAQSLSSSLDLDEVLTNVLEGARHLFDAVGCTVWLLGPQKGDLICLKATGPCRETLVSRQLEVVDGIVGWVAREGQSLIVSDTRADERHFKEIDQATGFEIRSLLSVPLEIKQELIGVLQVAHQEPSRFDERDMALLEPLAASAAIAIENARLYDEANKLRVFNENIVQSMQEGIVVEDEEGYFTFANRAAAELLGCSIEELIGQRWGQITAPENGAVTDPEVDLRSVEGGGRYETVLCTGSGQRLPVLVSARQLHEDGRSAGHLRVFTDITERKRAEESLQQRAEELRVLHALSQQVSASLSLEQVTEAALQGVIESLAPDLAMLLLLREDGLHLQGLQPEHSAWKDVAPGVHRAGECLCGLALESGKPIFSCDIHVDSRCTLEECKAIGMRSFAALPMLKGTDVLGVLGLASLGVRDFSEQEAFLRALAGNVSVGLQNALLHQEIRLHAANLERHVAQLRQAQDALRESEERYRLLFERNLAGVYRSTLDGRILACNEALAKILGYEGVEELLAVPAVGIYADPQDRERFITQLRAEGVVTGKEWQLRRKDGSSVWCLETASLIESESGLPVVVQGTVFDITKRKRMEEAVQESEARYRMLFENAPLCIFEVDLSQVPHAILQTNRQTEAVYGWSPSEITSVTIPMIFAADAMPDHKRLTDRILAGEAITLESTHRRRDGSLFPVRLSATPALASEPRHIILAVEDISAEQSRRSEEEAIAEERRRMAREIHDGLAQNLASLRLRARLWYNLIDEHPEQMHDEVEAMRDFLSEQIQEVRRSIFALRPVALDELGFFPALRQFVVDFGEQNQLRIDLRILGAEDRLPSYLEPVLFRVIQEALNNVSRHAEAATVWIDLDLRKADSLALAVRDDGQGFDTAILDQSIRLGHLGLTQMRERAEELGGTLQVQSWTRRGTEVRVVLPTAQT